MPKKLLLFLSTQTVPSVIYSESYSLPKKKYWHLCKVGISFLNRKPAANCCNTATDDHIDKRNSEYQKTVLQEQKT